MVKENQKSKSNEYFILYGDLRNERRNVNSGKSLAEVSKFAQRDCKCIGILGG